MLHVIQRHIELLVTYFYLLLLECPTGCDTCTVDVSDNDKTKCTNGQCTAWDTKKAYTNGDGGACVLCPDNCKVNLSLISRTL